MPASCIYALANRMRQVLHISWCQHHLLNTWQKNRRTWAFPLTALSRMKVSVPETIKWNMDKALRLLKKPTQSVIVNPQHVAFGITRGWQLSSDSRVTGKCPCDAAASTAGLAQLLMLLSGGYTAPRNQGEHGCPLHYTQERSRVTPAGGKVAECETQHVPEWSSNTSPLSFGVTVSSATTLQGYPVCWELPHHRSLRVFSFEFGFNQSWLAKDVLQQFSGAITRSYVFSHLRADRGSSAIRLFRLRDRITGMQRHTPDAFFSSICFPCPSCAVFVLTCRTVSCTNFSFCSFLHTFVSF